MGLYYLYLVSHTEPGCVSPTLTAWHLQAQICPPVLDAGQIPRNGDHLDFGESEHPSSTPQLQGPSHSLLIVAEVPEMGLSESARDSKSGQRAKPNPKTVNCAAMGLSGTTFTQRNHSGSCLWSIWLLIQNHSKVLTFPCAPVPVRGRGCGCTHACGTEDETQSICPELHFQPL